jgi:hypothetical protein
MALNEFETIIYLSLFDRFGLNNMPLFKYIIEFNDHKFLFKNRVIIVGDTVRVS